MAVIFDPPPHPGLGVGGGVGGVGVLIQYPMMSHCNLHARSTFTLNFSKRV